MARTRSTASLLADLPVPAQIQAQGLVTIVQIQAKQDPSAGNINEYLGQQFLQWFANEHADQFASLLQDFAYAQVKDVK